MVPGKENYDQLSHQLVTGLFVFSPCFHFLQGPFFDFPSPEALSIVVFIFNYNACHFVMVLYYYLHWIFSYICRELFFPLLRFLLPFITCQTFFIFSALLAFIYKASDWLTLTHTMLSLRFRLKEFLSALSPSPFRFSAFPVFHRRTVSFSSCAQHRDHQVVLENGQKINGWLNENPASWQEENSVRTAKSGQQKSESSESLKPMAAANFRLCVFVFAIFSRRLPGILVLEPVLFWQSTATSCIHWP